MGHSENKVAVTLPIVDEMIQRAKLPRTLMGGTEAMRKAGKKYLPQEPAESDDAYKARLDRTVLFNAFGKAVRTLTGRMLENGVVVSDTTSGEIKAMLEDVDLEGHDLEQFVHMVGEDAMQTGLAHILVDFPITPAKDGKILSKAEEKELGARPYFVHLTMEDIVGWRFTKVGGKKVLSQLRFKQTIQVEDGDYGVTEVQQIKVLNRGGAWEIHRKNTDGKWEKAENGTSTMVDISLVTFYTRYVAPMVGRPPLEDLAHVNVAHWQSSSDQRHIVHVARVPLLFATGFDDDENKKIEIGPNLLISQPEGATLGYVEHTGQAIESGSNDLKQLEDKMAILSMEPQLNSDPTAKTATARILDTTEAQSTLDTISGALEDSIDQALIYMAKWMGKQASEAGSVTINCKRPEQGMLDTTALQELGKARRPGAGIQPDISREAYLNELKRRGIVSPDFDIEADAAKIDDEIPGMGGLTDPTGEAA